MEIRISLPRNQLLLLKLFIFRSPLFRKETKLSFIISVFACYVNWLNFIIFKFYTCWTEPFLLYDAASNATLKRTSNDLMHNVKVRRIRKNVGEKETVTCFIVCKPMK